MANTEVKLIISADGTIAVDQLRKVAAGLKGLESTSGSLVSRIKAHWLGITAAIAGTAMLLNKAWSLAEMAAGYEEQMTALNRFAATYNTTATSIVADIKEITKGQIAMVDIAKISSKALALNVPLDKYKELAKYADAVGDALGMSTTQALEQLTEAAEKGTAKFMKSIVGVVDLDSKFGKLTERMTEQQKVTAMTDLMLGKLKNTYGDLSGSVKSTADKMELLTASMKDLQLTMGQMVIRLGAGLMGVFQGAAAAALYLSGGIFGIISALGKLTDLLKITTGLSKEYAEAKATANRTVDELMGKSKSNLEMAFAPADVLAKAMATTKTPEDKNKKWLDDMKLATMDWTKRIDSLNPALDETDKQLKELTADAAKLTEKWGKQKWISEGLEKGKEFINIQEAERQFDVYAKLKEEQRNIDKKYADETAAEIMKLADERLKALSDSAENTRKVYNDIAVERETINKGELAGKIKQYDNETTEVWRHAQEIIASHEFTAEQILTIYDEASAKQLLLDLKNRDALLAANGTLVEGLNEGFRKYVINLENSFQQGLQIAQQVTAGMENAFMGFFDYTSKEFLKWGSLVQNILHEVYKAMVMTQIVKPIVGGITNLFAPSPSTLPHELALATTGLASGGIMTSHGPLPLRKYGGGGIAYTPQLALYGEGRTPEAYVPLPDGRRIPAVVDLRGNAGGGATIVNIQMENKTGLPNLSLKQTGQKTDERQKTKTIVLELAFTDIDFINSFKGAMAR